MKTLSVNIALIKEEMDRLNLDFKAFEAKSGVKADTIYRIIRRRRASFKNLSLLANAIHRNPRDLLI